MFYRGITLLSVRTKVYSEVLERRVHKIVEPWIQDVVFILDVEQWTSSTTSAGSLFVCIAGTKSDSFPLRVGLRQGCPLSPILFITFMDRISRRSQGVEEVRFGDFRIGCLLFAVDVVLFASSVCNPVTGLKRPG